ncbi:MAG: Wzz/FepE/Etk N-terminal domain-containing protein [Hyphomicrobiaceae bacterium]
MFHFDDDIGHHARSVGIQDLARVLVASWRRILLFTCVASALAATVVQFIPRKYSAAAIVIYDPTSSINFFQNTRWLEPSVEMNMRIESQVEVINSVSVAERVIARLDLVNDPEFSPTSSPDRPERPASLASQAQDVPAKSEEGAAEAQTKDHDPHRIQAIVPAFLNRLSKRRVGRSTVIEIHFTSKDAEKAVRIVNAIADAYIEFDLEQKSEALRRGGKWLQGRLEELRKQSFDSLREVERFKRSGQGTISDASVRLAELESTAQTFRRLYEGVHLQLMETLQRISYPVADARILSKASVSRVSAEPKTKLIILFATGLGAAIGAVFSLIQMSADGVVRTLEDLARTNQTLLGRVVSRTSAHRPWRPLSQSPQTGRHGVSSHVSGGLRRLPETALVDTSPIDAKVATGLCAIAIRGAGRQSASSILSILLARHFAANGRRVVVIDASPDNGLLSTLLGLGQERGLADMAHDGHGLDNALLFRDASGFDAIPLGSASARNAILAAPPDERVLAAIVDPLLERYDICLIDLPPMGARIDAMSAIEYIAQGTVFALERATIGVEEFESLIHASKSNAITNLGTIFVEAPLPRGHRKGAPRPPTDSPRSGAQPTQETAV